MFENSKIMLGIAPIAWTNDDMPDLGAENTFEQCVSEMALAGFKGCEVGNKYPKDENVLKHALDIRGLTVSNAWFSTFLTTKPYEETEKDFIKHIDFLYRMGARVVGISEQGHSIQGTKLPIFDAKYNLNNEEWKRMLDGFNRLGYVAKQHGISLTYHHHMGTVVQTAEEIDRMMEGTDKEYFSLLYDSGHLAYCGEDYLAVLEKYATRIRHVHLKDVRPQVLERVKNEKMSFLDGVRAGAFTVPGDGVVDFSSIFMILDKANYSGWMVVEAEQDPAIANPFEYALKARKYIKDIGGI